MLLTDIKIDKETVQNMCRESFDFSHNSNDAHLRERYAFMMKDEQGFTLVEGNTNGFFIVGKQAGFSHTVSWLKSC